MEKKYMFNEMNRLRSFKYFTQPDEMCVSFIQLAKNGFYFDLEQRKIRCFSCNFQYECQNALISLEVIHNPSCSRRDLDKPFHRGANSLEQVGQLLSPGGSVSSRLQHNNFAEDIQQSETYNSLPQGFGNENFTPFSKKTSSNNSQPQHSNSLLSHNGSMSHSNDVPPNVKTPNSNEFSQNRRISHGNDLSQQASRSNSNNLPRSEMNSHSTISPSSHTTCSATTASTSTISDQRKEKAKESSQVSNLPDMDIGMISYPQFLTKHARLATFRGWNKNHHDVAESGFFQKGNDGSI
jgi:hypothetical protein